MIKCSCRCYYSRNWGRLALHYKQQSWSKIKKKYINLCDHQNSTIDIVADTGSPVMKVKGLSLIVSKNLSFWDNPKILSSLTANSSASNRTILVFLTCMQVS